MDTSLQRTETGDSGGRARARVSANGRAAMGEGWQSPLLLAEAIAQATLLLEGGSSRRPAGRGYLAGIQDLEMTRPPQAGETLEIEVRLAGSFGAVLRFDGRVLCGDEVLASGSILVRKGNAA